MRYLLPTHMNITQQFIPAFQKMAGTGTQTSGTTLGSTEECATKGKVKIVNVLPDQTSHFLVEKRENTQFNIEPVERSICLHL